MKKLTEEAREQLYIKIVKNLVEAYGETDNITLSDDDYVLLIDGLDRLNASRVNHLISASDYIYDAARAIMVQEGMLKPDESTEQAAVPATHSRGLQEVLDEHEQIGSTLHTEAASPDTNSDKDVGLTLETGFLGRPYEATLDPTADDVAVYNAILEGLGAAPGLSFSAGTLTITGEPETTGDFIFQLSYLPTGELHRLHSKVSLRILPDTEAVPDHIQLGVATAHEPYEYKIDLESRDKFSFEIKGLETYGLDFDAQNLIIRGTPTEAAKLDMALSFKWKHPDGAEPGSIPMSLNIKADDRRFWKDIAPEPNQPYPKTAVEEHVKELPHGHVLLGGSRRGPENAHRGLHRNDDLRMRFDEESGWMVLAIADGLGDAPYSRKGAELACKVAEKVLLKRLTEPEANESAAIEAAVAGGGEALEAYLQYTLVTATYNAFRYIIRFGDSEGHPPEAFGTTLRLLIAKRLPDKSYFVAGMGLGDGLTALYREEQKEVVLLGNHHAKSEDGNRVSLLHTDISGDSKAVRDRIDWHVATSCSGIVMASNGFSRLWFEENTALDDPASWQKLWSSLSKIRPQTKSQQEKSLTELLSLGWDSEPDDRTVAIWL
ncbi:MAG: protein phosphatase 2C domain-containing protein [Bacteroidia bacterium]